MKFISNKIRIQAGHSTDDLYKGVGGKEPKQQSLPMTKPPVIEPPKPPDESFGKYKQPHLPMTLPPGQTPFGPHNTQDDNIFNDLEKPHVSHLGIQAPHHTEGTGAGIRASRFHVSADGTRTGVAKGDANSFLKEPLVYQIGEHIQPGLIPPTVIRNHKDENFGTGRIIPHSIMEFSPGKTRDNLSNEERQAMLANPHHSAINLFDHLVANNDRHGANIMYDHSHPDPNQRVKAIDNGGAFSHYTDNPLDEMKHMGADYHPEFIKGIQDSDEDYLSNLFDRVKAHPASQPIRGHDSDAEGDRKRLNGFRAGNFSQGDPDTAKEAFLSRLRQVKSGFDQGISTPQQMHRFLSSGVVPGGKYDNTNQNTWNNTNNNEHNNTWNNTYNNRFNNEHGNKRDNTWDNTHNNHFNNTHNNTANNTDNAFIKDTEDFNREPQLKPEDKWDRPNRWEPTNQTAKDPALSEERARQEYARRKLEYKKWLREQNKENMRDLIQNMRGENGSGNESLQRFLDEVRNPQGGN